MRRAVRRPRGPTTVHHPHRPPRRPAPLPVPLPMNPVDSRLVTPSHTPRRRPAALLLASAVLALAGCAAPPAANRTAAAESTPAAPAPAATAGTANARPAPAAAGAAYQLQACKTVDGWQILDGRCDGVGAFQGSGVAARQGVTFIGQFVAGVPQGKGTMCLQSASQWPPRNGAKPCGNDMTCAVTFTAGKLGGQAMVCEESGGQSVWGPRANARIKIDSPSGFFLGDGADAKARDDRIERAVSTDQASVEIDGQVVYRPLALGSSRTAGRAVGEVRELRMARGKMTFDRFKGTLTVPTVNAREVKTGELQVKGVLEGHFQGATANFTPYAVEVTASGAVQRDSLVQVRYGAQWYDLVFVRDAVFKGVDAGRVLYYKDHAGVEFDGTDPVCLAKIKRTGMADLTPQRHAGSGAFEGYKLMPRCGRITTPTGSFAGTFRDGKPEP